MAAIAREKAGIMKPGTPVVVYLAIGGLGRAAGSRAAMRAPITRWPLPDVVRESGLDGHFLPRAGLHFPELHIGLLGRHQVCAAGGTGGRGAGPERGWAIERSISRGVEATRWATHESVRIRSSYWTAHTIPGAQHTRRLRSFAARDNLLGILRTSAGAIRVCRDSVQAIVTKPESDKASRATSCAV